MKIFSLFDRYPLKIKLFIQNILLVLFISLFVFLFFPKSQKQISLDRAKEHIKVFKYTTSISIFDALEFLDRESTDITLGLLGGIKEIDFITVYTSDKQLFTSLNFDKYQQFLAAQPNFEQLFAEEETTELQERLLIYSEIERDDSRIGYILISFHINDIIQATREAYTVAFIVSILAIFLGVIFSSVLSRPIVTPINELIDFFERMADGKGDLTKRLTVESNDEFGQLGTEFNRFLDAQNMLIHDIKNVAEVVDEKIGQIESLAEQNNDLINLLISTFEYISNDAYEVYKGASLNVKSAQNVTERSEKTIKTSIKSQKAAEKSIQLMEGIKTEVTQLEKDMTKLHDNTKKIRMISNTLKDIADRTTILALNTSIEANKAGDAGVGFLIIAEEIQKLAEQSGDSLDSINQLNHSIQGGLDKSFRLTLSSAARVDEGMTNIEETGNQILDSVDSVKNNLNYIHEVFKIAQNQQSQIQKIVQNMDHSSSNINSIKSSVTSTLSSVREQKMLIGNLKKLMDNFKISR